MWIQKAYSVDVYLISAIIGLPQAGVYPTFVLKKDKDPTMITRIKNKYDMVRANKGFLISSIGYSAIRFVAKMLYCKMLRTLRPTQCTIGAVALAKLYAKGVQINWSQFLLNELL